MILLPRSHLFTTVKYESYIAVIIVLYVEVAGSEEANPARIVSEMDEEYYKL